jgi:hypothetical protein
MITLSGNLTTHIRDFHAPGFRRHDECCGDFGSQWGSRRETHVILFSKLFIGSRRRESIDDGHLYFEMTGCQEVHREERIIAADKIYIVSEAHGTFEGCRSNVGGFQKKPIYVVYRNLQGLFYYSSLLEGAAFEETRNR